MKKNIKTIIITAFITAFAAYLVVSSKTVVDRVCDIWKMPTKEAPLRVELIGLHDGLEKRITHDELANVVKDLKIFIKNENSINLNKNQSTMLQMQLNIQKQIKEYVIISPYSALKEQDTSCKPANSEIVCK